MENGGTRSRGAFECVANEAITFHLVEPGASDEHPWHSRASFPPEFTHQLFGEDEVIVGYQDLKINVYQHAASFFTHIDIKHELRLQKAGARRRVHDLTAILKETFPAGFCNDREEFAKQLPQHSVQFPDLLEKHGKLVLSAKTETGEPGSGTSYEVWHMDLKDATVREWHSRLQSSTLFFIETASLIDNKDPEWELWVAVERMHRAPGEGQEGSSPVLTVAGFCTAFRFFHWPDDTRLRISQVLVLPPYQGKGHGMRLLEAASAEAKGKEYYDFTVEDPNEPLQSLRETLDARNLLQFPPIKNALSAAMSKAENAPPPPPPPEAVAPSVVANTTLRETAENGGAQEGPSRSPAGRPQNPLALGKDIAEEVRKMLKISHKQVACCWEVLVWMRLEASGASASVREWWRRLVLRRLYAQNLGGAREAKAAHEKRIVDTLEKDDGKMMFVMFCSRKRLRPSPSNGDANAPGAGAGVPEEEGAAKQELTEEELTQKRREALTELFAIREQEISAVCKRLERMGSNT